VTLRGVGVYRGGMTGEITTLDHVVLAVRDLEGATRSYARLLGRAPSWRGEHPGAGTANSLFRLRNTYVELLAPAGGGPIGSLLEARLAGEAGEGVFALAFGTDDAEACRKRLEAAGLEPGPVQQGMGRDSDSGAFREWQNVMLPPARTRGAPMFVIEHLSPPELLPEVGPVGDAAAAVHALDHVVLRASDGEGCRALLEDGLGLRLALDRSFEKFGFRGLFFRVGGATVEVSAPLGGGAASDEPDRFLGLAWKVGDVPAARARLAAAEFDVSEVRDGRKPGTAVFTVRQPTAGVPTLVIGPA
jgi:catechol 2,3-dioxygenase-like lactoylglutathione lyase family enzyme